MKRKQMMAQNITGNDADNSRQSMPGDAWGNGAPLFLLTSSEVLGKICAIWSSHDLNTRWANYACKHVLSGS